MRMHHMHYHSLVLKWYKLVAKAPGFDSIPPAAQKRKVTVIRYTHHPLDDENLAFSAKPIFDVLRPDRVLTGVYKTGKRKGQPWTSHRIGHGLILEDDPAHVVRDVKVAKPPKGVKPFTEIIIEIPDAEDDT
jgi:hypothetical protein